MKCDDLSNELESSQKECRSQGRTTHIAFARTFLPFIGIAPSSFPFQYREMVGGSGASGVRSAAAKSRMEEFACLSMCGQKFHVDDRALSCSACAPPGTRRSSNWTPSGGRTRIWRRRLRTCWTSLARGDAPSTSWTSSAGGCRFADDVSVNKF